MTLPQNNLDDPYPPELNISPDTVPVNTSSPSVVPWAEVATKTLARVLEDQGKYAEAAEIYAALADQYPDEASTLQARAVELYSKARKRKYPRP